LNYKFLCHEPVPHYFVNISQPNDIKPSAEVTPTHNPW